MERIALYRWAKRNLPLIILVAAVLVFFRHLVFMKKVPLGSDLHIYYFPAWSFFGRAFKAGHLATWCDYIYCGFPLFADSEAGIFYPLNFFSFYLSAAAGFNLTIWLHYLLAGLSFYAYGREIGMSRWSASLMAIPYALSGFTLAHLVHVNAVITVAWLPFYLMFIERGLKRRETGQFVFAGIVLGIQFLAGFLMVPLFALLITPFYIFLYPLREGEGRTQALTLAVKGLLAILVVGFGLGMVQNLSSYFLVKESYRATGLSPTASNILNLPAPQYLTFFFPKLFGEGVDVGYWGAWYFEDLYGYVGLLPLFLSIFALRRKRRWHATFFFWVLVVSAVAALGNAGILWRLIHALPGFSILKAPCRFLLLMDFSLLVLGGLGMDRLLGWTPSTNNLEKATRWVVGLGGAWMGIWLIVALLLKFDPLGFRTFYQAFSKHIFSPLPGDTTHKYHMWSSFAQLNNFNFLIPILLAFLIPASFWMMKKRLITRGMLMGFLVFIVLFEVFSWGQSMHKFSHINAARNQPPAIDVIKEDKDSYRVTIAKEAKAEQGEDFVFAPDLLMAYGLEDPRGQSTIPPLKYDYLQEWIQRVSPEKVLSLLGVRYLIAQPVRAGGRTYDVSNPLVLSGAHPRAVFPCEGSLTDGIYILSHVQGGGLLPEGTTVAWVSVKSDGFTLGPYPLKIGRETEQIEAEELVRRGERSADGPRIYNYKAPGWRQKSWSYEGKMRLGVEMDLESLEIELDKSMYDRLLAIKALSLHAPSGRLRPLERGEVIYAGPRVCVFRNPRALPRAFMVGSVIVEENWQTAVARSCDPLLDLNNQIVIEKEMLDADTLEKVESWPSGRSVGGEVEVVDFEGERKIFRLHAEEDGVLFVSLNYLPGWKGVMDGKSVTLMRAYGCLTAVYVTQGDHILELRYKPPGLVTGAAITITTLALLFLYFAFRLYKKRVAKKGKGLVAQGRETLHGGEGSGSSPPPSLSERPSITAFFPAYNDQDTIGMVVEKAISVLEELTDDYEVIVIDDGSTDQTGQVIREIMERNPRVRLICHQFNRGYGAALRSGFGAATKDLVFYTDGDGQYDVSELKSLYVKRDEADVINGYKIKRNDPFYRILLGKAYNMVARRIFGLVIRDVDCDFRLIRRGALEAIELESEGGAICVELVRKLQDRGFTFAEQPVHHYKRNFGRSRFFRIKHLTAMGKGIFHMWWKLIVAPRLQKRS